MLTVFSQGPCLECEAYIRYGPPSKCHLAAGNAWLQDIRRTWQRPAKLSRNKKKLNDHTSAEVLPYLCGLCAKDFGLIVTKPTVYSKPKGKRQRIPDREQLRRLPYAEFLLTPFWDEVRKTKLQDAEWQCEECGHNDEILHVHHITYKNHGEEDKHLEDLVVLCCPCHEGRHEGKRVRK